MSHEVASLAGQQKLGKLVVLYDDNAVSLDGLKKRSDISNNLARFASYGWDIREVADGNDLKPFTMQLKMLKCLLSPR